MHVPLYFQIDLKVIIIVICKALYTILTKKKSKSTELGELTRSCQSSEASDVCQLFFKGHPPTLGIIPLSICLQFYPGNISEANACH